MVFMFGRRAEKDDTARDEAARAEARNEETAGARRADSNAELRARTRRRLIGAAALLVAAIIVLPMVLDDTQRPVPDNVSIEIPGEKTPFKPRLSMPSAADATKAARPAGEAASAAKVAPATQPEPLAKGVPAPAPAPTAKPGDKESKASAAPAASPAPVADAAPAKATAAASAGESGFALQAAALASDAAVRNLVDRLKKNGFAPYTEKVDTSSGARTRVRIGPFATREEAEQAREKLKGMNINATLIGKAK